MENKKLEHWAKQLLDTGKRNNLVNFRAAKSSSAEILMPSADVLFEKALAGAEFEVLETGDDGKSTTMDRDLYRETYGEKLRKKKQILLYSAGGNAGAAIKNIEKRSRSVMEETGVNVAYMAFGFVNWTEEGKLRDVFRAPLILIPIRIFRKSAIDPWSIRTVEDELVVNPTFDYLVRAEKGIGLPPHTDEETLAEYLLKVQDITSKLGWTVAAECVIGLFSFLKINMYHDLVAHEEEILKNENVRALLGNPVDNTSASQTENASGEEPIPELDPVVDLHTVIDADSSQTEAILMAKQGKSFVLQGPPGTGKSQTITNIIAECLHDGKKVLFVSEKQAALNVVYDKLVKAGLFDFCLQLHSYKANKKDVIAELIRTLYAEKTSVLMKAQDVISAKIRFMDQLDAYEGDLHVPVECINESVYEMYGHLTSLAGIPDVDFLLPNIQSRGSAHLNEARLLMETFVKYIPEIGPDFRQHTWYGYTGRDGSAAQYADLSSKADKVTSLFDKLAEYFAPAHEKFGITCDSFRAYSLHMNAMDLLGRLEVSIPALLSPERLDRVISVAEALADRSQSLISEKNRILTTYEERIFDLSGQEMSRAFLANAHFISRLFSSEYRRHAQELRIASRDGRKRTHEMAVHDAEMLAAYQEKLAAFQTMASPVIPYLGDTYRGLDTDWNSLLSQLADLRTGIKEGLPFDSYAGVHDLDREKRWMLEMSRGMRPILKNLGGLLAGMQQVIDQNVLHLYMDPADKIRGKFSRFLSGRDTFYNWTRFYMTLRRMQEEDILSFTEYVIDQAYPITHLSGLYEKALYMQWLNYVTLRSEPLSYFTRASQEQAVREFAYADRTQFEISQAQIRSELSAGRPSLDLVIPGSQVAVLRREGEKKRKQKAIRTLFQEIGDLIQLLKPCFLMSPLSVGTFLSGSSISFDVVVFDEASQIFPQDAIGAIYRGKQLIVVGDSRQMPPTNFFNAIVEPESDEETGDVADFESILDICQASLPQLSLRWHYRSRYESLIAFSNHNFYGDTLVTFPSVTREREGVGVDYCYVPDGVFNRKTHQNIVEAERVLDLIYKELREHPDRSLGVVAFSIAQQEVIDRMLAVRRRNDPSLEEFFSRDREDPFFIKNLETVQGDERDTIIFSTAYGKDESGKLFHNFGPLNRAGGERRLNVAVTRAKENVILVSSMHFSDIDPKKSSAEGVLALRNYLQYAELGQAAALGNSTHAAPCEQLTDDALLSSVYTFLRENGIPADLYVGVGSSNVEIGIRDAEERDYVLAVETDGDLYHMMGNTRDRDRLRQEILERMGWRYYRIWSTEWIRNGQVERERLLAACREAREIQADKNEELRTSAPSEADLDNQDFEYTENEEARFPEYRQADIIRLARECNFFQEYISEILKIEAPASEEELIKRICFVFGREHVTSVVKREYEERMTGCEKFGIERRNGFLYLAGGDPYVFRVPGVKRQLRHIAPEELAAGMRDLLRENVSAEKDALYLAVARMQGWTRVTDQVREWLDQAYELV